MNERHADKNRPSKKRMEKYHTLFKSIPKNEVLECTCSCLLNDGSKYYQGKIYIGTEHVCFFSKSFFGKAAIIIKMKTIISIELTTKIILQQRLSVVTYEKTYAFIGVSLKDEVYPVTLDLWQKVLRLSPWVKSVFQVDAPRTFDKVEDRAMLEEERVYEIPVRELLKEIVSEEKAKKFYETLTNEKIKIKMYVNRRTIQFSNEFIDEIYRIDHNMLSIEYHSKGSLCRIYIQPLARNTTKVRIVEKYNYTTQHYFEYIRDLVENRKKRREPKSILLPLYAMILLSKVIMYILHYGD